MELSGKNTNVGERIDIVDYKVAMKIQTYTHQFIHTYPLPQKPQHTSMSQKPLHTQRHTWVDERSSVEKPNMLARGVTQSTIT